MNDLSKLGGVTLVYAYQGDTEKADAGIAQLQTSLQSSLMGRATLFLIYIQTTLGRHEIALQMIEDAIGYRLPFMIMLNAEPILQPLHQYPRFHELMKQILGEDHIQDIPKKKYQNSSLKMNEAEKYYARLEEFMINEKSYLQPNLSLRKLAGMIDVHPNKLSQLLNEKGGKNFSEYINQYRVEYFKEIAIDPKNAHLSLLGLAYESGFNSKTTFNTFFKKETGTTPKRWLDSTKLK